MMKEVTKRLVRFIKQETGLTTVEYAIGGTLVSLAVVAAFTGLGNAIAGQINLLIAAM